MPRKMQKITDVPMLAPRRRDGHKGDFGKALIVGGSEGMIGAVALAANAALRGGAGLVTFAVPRTIQQTVALLCPCATSVALACNERSEPRSEAVGQMLQAAERCDVLAIGPGMAVGAGQLNLLRAALEQNHPLVLDADGLNNLCRIDDWPKRRQCPLVLTPHPGEFARLTGRSVQEIQSDRQAAAHDAMERWTSAAKTDAPALVCVLKGAETVVTNGRRCYVNNTGNPGMASGGSGDVLTGLIAALVAQGCEPFDAACIAVWIHGRAGDLAVKEWGEVSLIASDLLDFLPQAFQQVVG